MYSRYSKTIARWMIEHQGEYANRDELRAAAVDVRGTTAKFASATMRQLEIDGELRPEGYRHPAVGEIPTEPAADSTPPAPVLPVSHGLTEEALRGEIDLHFRARRFLEGIPRGLFYSLDDPEVTAIIPKSSARQVFGDKRYDAFRGVAFANQRMYLGHPERIAAMRQEGILR
jgi:hypothetical protein